MVRFSEAQVDAVRRGEKFVDADANSADSEKNPKRGRVAKAMGEIATKMANFAKKNPMAARVLALATVVVAGVAINNMTTNQAQADELPANTTSVQAESSHQDVSQTPAVDTPAAAPQTTAPAPAAPAAPATPAYVAPAAPQAPAYQAPAPAPAPAPQTPVHQAPVSAAPAPAQTAPATPAPAQTAPATQETVAPAPAQSVQPQADQAPAQPAAQSNADTAARTPQVQAPHDGLPVQQPEASTNETDANAAQNESVGPSDGIFGSDNGNGDTTLPSEEHNIEQNGAKQTKTDSENVAEGSQVNTSNTEVTKDADGNTTGEVTHNKTDKAPEDDGKTNPTDGSTIHADNTAPSAGQNTDPKTHDNTGLNVDQKTGEKGVIPDTDTTIKYGEKSDGDKGHKQDFNAVDTKAGNPVSKVVNGHTESKGGYTPKTPDEKPNPKPDKPGDTTNNNTTNNNTTDNNTTDNNKVVNVNNVKNINKETKITITEIRNTINNLINTYITNNNIQRVTHTAPANHVEQHEAFTPGNKNYNPLSQTDVEEYLASTGIDSATAAKHGLTLVAIAAALAAGKEIVRDDEKDAKNSTERAA